MNKSLQEIQALVNIYQKAKQGLIRTIAEKESRGNVTWYKRTLLDQIERQLKHLSEQSEKWTRETLPFIYQEGVDTTNSLLAKSGFTIDINKASFARMHTNAIESLVMDTLDDLSEANKYAGDQIKRVVNDAVTQKLAQGQTVRECKKAIINSLMEKGIDGVEGKDGRMMSLDAYASLVARSRTREATNTAMINQLTGLGRDLVKISSHNSSCPICAAYEGRVFSISGKDARYPPLSVVFRGIYANIHPNCSHVLLPYIEELADDPEADRTNSNLPFDIDPRSRKEVDIYNEVRRKKQRLREDRRQWERYTLAFPDDTPKTFQAFCSMKRSNNIKWQKLQQQYKDYIKSSEETLLPGFENAVINDNKFIGYALDKSKDYDKAIAFEKALGYTKDNYKQLKSDIQQRLPTTPAKRKASNQYGDKYEMVMDLTGPNGKTAKVLSAWIVNEKGTRMVTVHVDK